MPFICDAGAFWNSETGYNKGALSHLWVSAGGSTGLGNCYGQVSGTVHQVVGIKCRNLHTLILSSFITKLPSSI